MLVHRNSHQVNTALTEKRDGYPDTKKKVILARYPNIPPASTEYLGLMAFPLLMVFDFLL